MHRKYYATLCFAVTLLLLTISPAYASPSLSLDSTASYNFTGKIHATQNCTTDPIGYANQACTGSTSPPAPKTVEVGLGGVVGWSVGGLSSSQVNLQVSYNVGLSVSPFPFFSFTPLIESGSFEQWINLSTRVESPSTSTGLLGSLFASAIQALPGSTIAGGTSGSLIQSMLSAQSFGPDYTEWWVNGPLSTGSPVQIFHGWSSVTGSESLDLGGSIGTRSAWIVTSDLNQTASLTIPNVKNLLGPSSMLKAMASVNLLWSFDKSADLLLRTNRTLTLSVHSVTPITISAIGGTADVTVTRDVLLTINLALVLSSTSLSLPQAASHPSTLMDAFLAMPWIALGLAGLAAGGFVTIIVRFARKGKTASHGPAPMVAPPPSACFACPLFSTLSFTFKA